MPVIVDITMATRAARQQQRARTAARLRAQGYTREQARLQAARMYPEPEQPAEPAPRSGRGRRAEPARDTRLGQSGGHCGKPQGLGVRRRPRSVPGGAQAQGQGQGPEAPVKPRMHSRGERADAYEPMKYSAYGTDRHHHFTGALAGVQPLGNCSAWPFQWRACTSPIPSSRSRARASVKSQASRDRSSRTDRHSPNLSWQADLGATSE